MASAAAATKLIAGGEFLLRDVDPAECFFPEDFTPEQRQIASTAADFTAGEVVPLSDAIERKDDGLMRKLLREAGELGLLAADVPEEYGGLELDKATSAIVAEKISGQASFSVAFSAHTGIGTLPIVWYGTAAQKTKYLPGLADGTLVGAYALSESTSGSDAVNARTRAVLSDDGQTYVLNGEKMWITNGGFADLYTVFARCAVTPGGDEKLTAFLVERGTAGFSMGKEEHKLGIRGSSTVALILSDCRIPAGNLLGEVGKGHHIAFNILNVGRYKLGNAAVGGARYSFEHALRYSKERKAFGKSISEFGLIREKLADMAVGVFVGEAVCYRTVGMIQDALADVKGGDTAGTQRAIEGYAVECSIVKVWASEMLDRVVDETVQIFGGYGYVEEYPAERAYRDARINRIFEGTNEINRLIIAGRLLKAAATGALALMPAIKRLMDEVMGASPESEASEERTLISKAKKLTLFAAGTAVQKFGMKLGDEQEVMGALADMIIEVFAMESAVLRAEKMGTALPASMARLYAERAIGIVEEAARKVVGASAEEGDDRRTQFAVLRRVGRHDPADVVGLRREIATATLRAGKYVV